MKPSRELDALIAERVMGEEVVKTPWKNKRGEGFYYTLGEPFWNDYAGAMELDNPVPPYSTDIAAAWLVVEKLKEMTTYNGQQWETREPWLSFTENLRCSWDKGPGINLWYLTPHAICLAALQMARGVEYETK